MRYRVKAAKKKLIVDLESTDFKATLTNPTEETLDIILESSIDSENKTD